MSVSGYERSRWYSNIRNDIMWGPVREAMEKYVKEGGHTIEEYTLPPEEADRWIEAAGKPIWDAWVAKMEAQGLPGRAVLEETLRLIEIEPPE